MLQARNRGSLPLTVWACRVYLKRVFLLQQLCISLKRLKFHVPMAIKIAQHSSTPSQVAEPHRPRLWL